MTLPEDYTSLGDEQKHEYIDSLQNEVSELQATLEELRSEFPTNSLSRMKQRLIAYPPVVKFRPHKAMRATVKHRIVEMVGYDQSEGYPGLATVSQGGTVVLWDASTGLKYESVSVGKGCTMAVGVNSNGTVLATGGLSCSIEVYSVGNQLREMLGSDVSLRLSSEKFDAARGTVTRRAPQYRFSLSGHNAAVSSLKFLDTTSIISGGQDSSIHIWDILTADSKCSMQESAPISGLDTFDQHTFVSVAQDGSIKIWDVREDISQVQKMSSTMPLTGVKFSPEGKSILVSLRNGLQLFDMRSSGVLENYTYRGGAITSLDMSRSGRLGVIGSDTGAVVALDLGQNRWFPPIDKRKDRISRALILQDAVYSSSWDGTLRGYSYP